MDAKKLKRKIRRSTGQDDPYERPSRSGEEAKYDKALSKSKGGLFSGFSDEEMEEMNKAQKRRSKMKLLEALRRK